MQENLTPQQSILTVSQLNRTSNRLLSNHFLTVLVIGEISNLSQPSSGHYYFSLKDEFAQVRCALFKNQLRKDSLRPENGKQVIAKAQVGLYEPRGDFQLIVESIEDAGLGVLQKAFEQLKQKLSAEGLFAAEHKQALPTLPQTIGVITSPSGAAIRDIVTVLKRRYPLANIIIYPVAVQGEQAKYDISNALNRANANPLCDVLILGRGGGSLEDLWAFNEEIVARAIFASRIPIISAVGHETDFTIADFVADIRAPTPSAAAEYVSPDQQQWLLHYQRLEARLYQLLKQRLYRYHEHIHHLHKRLAPQHPGQKLARNMQRIDELELRLNHVMHSRLQTRRAKLATQQAKLNQHAPSVIIQQQIQHFALLQIKLANTVMQRLQDYDKRLTQTAATLHAVSPLATLSRGYSLTSLADTGELLHSTEQLRIGQLLETRLSQGRCISEVKSAC